MAFTPVFQTPTRLENADIGYWNIHNCGISSTAPFVDGIVQFDIGGYGTFDRRLQESIVYNSTTGTDVVMRARADVYYSPTGSVSANPYSDHRLGSGVYTVVGIDGKDGTLLWSVSHDFMQSRPDGYGTDLTVENPDYYYPHDVKIYEHSSCLLGNNLVVFVQWEDYIYNPDGVNPNVFYLSTLVIDPEGNLSYSNTTVATDTDTGPYPDFPELNGTITHNWIVNQSNITPTSASNAGVWVMFVTTDASDAYTTTVVGKSIYYVITSTGSISTTHDLTLSDPVYLNGTNEIYGPFTQFGSGILCRKSKDELDSYVALTTGGSLTWETSLPYPEFSPEVSEGSKDTFFAYPHIIKTDGVNILVVAGRPIEIQSYPYATYSDLKDMLAVLDSAGAIVSRDISYNRIYMYNYPFWYCTYDCDAVIDGNYVYAVDEYSYRTKYRTRKFEITNLSTAIWTKNYRLAPLGRTRWYRFGRLGMYDDDGVAVTSYTGSDSNTHSYYALGNITSYGTTHIYVFDESTLMAYSYELFGSIDPPDPPIVDDDFLAESNTPLDGAINVPLTSLVTITFNEVPDSSSITMANIGMVSPMLGTIPWTYIITVGKTVFLDPWVLVPEDTVTVTAYNGVTWTEEDETIHNLDNSPYIFSFSTGAFLIPPILPPAKARYSKGAGRQGVLRGVQSFNGVQKGEYQ